MELWKPIPNYEGYYSVSDMGNVRSEPRLVPHILKGKFLPGSAIKSRINKQNGYPVVNLTIFNRRKTFPVHVLVCLAFLGPRPIGAEVCHNDGDRTNAKLSNLRYGTSKENKADMLRHGSMARGARIKQSRLTEDDVRNIRADNRLQSEIAKQYGVGISAISNIKNRIHWRHVE